MKQHDTKIMKKLLVYLFFLTSFTVMAQDIKFSTKNNDVKLASLPYYNFGRGLGLTAPDSLFQFNIRFRMQNRMTYIQNDDGEEIFDGQIRRLRLRFDGYVGNPKFLYAIQLSFAPGDVGIINEGENVNIIRDAIIFYRPDKHWSFAFGQTKLPGNRQRINSSGALQLTDRSINNARFNIDRDFGWQAYYLESNKEKFSYNIKSAVSTGNGRNVTKNPDNGFALTGKVELFPLGSFTNDGSFFEGDIVRESKPKLMVSGVFHRNVNARLSQGQLGFELYEKKTMESVLLDAMLKYQGWAFMTAYMNRMANDPIAINPDEPTEFNYVYVGQGFDYQLSYNFINNMEIIGRYSTQNVDDSIYEFTPNTKTYTLGFTKYIWEHSFKIQTEVTYDEMFYFDGNTKNNWLVRFQVEIGI
jgi:phosphate-selective porin OprO and OprP